jgi:hypothetical protein
MADIDIRQAVKEVVEWFARTENRRSDLPVNSELLTRLKDWLRQCEQRDLDPNRKENEHEENRLIDREEKRFREAWDKTHTLRGERL